MVTITITCEECGKVIYEYRTREASGFQRMAIEAALETYGIDGIEAVCESCRPKATKKWLNEKEW